MRRRDLMEVTLAALLLVLLFVLSPNDELPPDVVPRSFDGLAAGLLVAATTALLLCRRAPVLAVVVTLACNAAWHQVPFDDRFINVPTAVALYAAGLTGSRRVQLTSAVLGTVPVFVMVVLVRGDSARYAVQAAGWCLAALLFGALVHDRRLLMDSYRRRAVRAEAEQEAEARRRVTEERLRIARDLHDLLGHTVSAMMVQAGVAADALPDRPAKAVDALRALRQAGRQATGEVRATVELLREPVPAGRSPSPGLADIGSVVASAERLGLRVDHRGADAVELDPLVELTVYRIVQEALTNVARHADADEVRVAVRHGDGHVVVEITDDGVGPSPGYRPGTGLTGMVERAALAGGGLRHGPGPDGGFRVTACLPVTGPGR